MRRSSIRLSAILSIVGLIASSETRAVNNNADWKPTFGPPGVDAPGGEVRAVAVYQQTLVLGGAFVQMAGGLNNNIAAWDGTEWSSIGTGLNNAVKALAVSGTDLYAGGVFTSPASKVAKWNGSAWSALGSGIGGGDVNALAIYGGDLYAGGNFTTAGGTVINNIAKWNGSSWSAVGSGLNGTVYAFALYDGKLAVGGSFTVGDCANVATWNGSSWQALDKGTNNPVLALALDGSDLMLGGQFTSGTNIGLQGDETVTLNHVAKYNGDFQAYGSGLGSGSGDVYSVGKSSGGTIYAGGTFTTSAGAPASYLARYSGSWQAVSGGSPNAAVNAVGFYTVGGSENLLVGGLLSMMGSTGLDHIGRWDGSNWLTLGYGSEYVSSTRPIKSLLVDGSTLYAGGAFRRVGGMAASKIAKWTGSVWQTMGSGMDPSTPDGNSEVRSIHKFGSDIYAGGDFTNAGGTAANRIAKWNGSSWSAVGSGFGTSGNYVAALATYGGKLIAGGLISSPSGNVAVFDAGSWSTLGSGRSSYVTALALYGGDLVATGDGGVWKWNGSSWSTLGAFTGGGGSVGHALAVQGTDLYVAGDFIGIDGATKYRIARYNGSTWSAVGAGFDGYVYGLRFYHGDLIATGSFNCLATGCGGATYNGIARWNGTSWSAMNNTSPIGFNDAGYALAVRTHEMFVGGKFWKAAGKQSVRLALYDEGDTIAPEAITTLYAAGSCDAIHLSWLAPGDDGAENQATLYDVRSSNSAITTDGEFTAAAQETTFAPASPGSAESIVLFFGGCSGTKYFAVKTRDEVPNWSPISNSSSAQTYCGPLLCNEAAPEAPDGEGERAVVERVEIAVVGRQPAREELRIVFGVPADQAGKDIELAVFDVSGRRAASLIGGKASQGRHTVTWDLRSQTGGPVADGIYYVRLRVGNESLTHRVAVLGS